jgi:hypothetical protein
MLAIPLVIFIIADGGIGIERVCCLIVGRGRRRRFVILNLE